MTFTRIDQSIAYGALFTAHHLRVKAIVALTESGSTALWMSRHRIDMPDLRADAQPRRPSARRSLYRNVTTMAPAACHATAHAVLRQAEDLLLAKGAWCSAVT